ncbi:thioredoxin family protein [Bacillus pseudomycoides]
MTKKIIFSIVVISLSIVSLFFIFNSKDLDKPNYTNVGMKEFQKKLDSKEDFKIYVYKTSCAACQSTKPLLNEVIKEEGKEVFAINMEVEENMDISFLKKQNIQKTPTLLHYKDGSEINRLEGEQSKKDLKAFMN